MDNPVQNRARKTRAKLITTASLMTAESGYSALRVEELVRRAGVAKGTFFAHFRDRDTLMEHLIGAEFNTHLDTLETLPPPRDVASLIDILTPLMEFAISERAIFDILLRYSGAAAIAEIGPIAHCLNRLAAQLAIWLKAPHWRKDVDPELLAGGVGAFMLHVMALNFCALHETTPLRDRLTPLLEAWLLPLPSTE